jgi:PadR family transcriptional regulator PadR
MRRQGYLGEFEQLVLLATLRLRGSANGPAIAAELEEQAGRRVSRGALYGTLDRLERKGYLDWSLEPGTEERSGQPLRRFQVTEAGLEILRSAQAAVRRLAAGLEDLLSEGG